MAESVKTQNRPPPSMTHEGCGGTICFLKTPEELPETRICQSCEFKETYEWDQLIIIARPGVTKEDLENFCEMVGLKRVEIPKLDKNSVPGNEIFAVSVLAAAGGKSSDPDTWIKDYLKDEATWFEKYKAVVLAICRKPKSTSHDKLEAMMHHS